MRCLPQALTLIAFLTFDDSAHGQAPVQLELERTIALPNVSGRIDHLAVDVPHQRLFVAELGNGSVDKSTFSKKEEYDYAREDVPYELEDALRAEGAEIPQQKIGNRRWLSTADL